MARGDNLKRQVEARIAASPLELTVHYPPSRPAATGTAPGATLVSPLTGPPVTTVVIPPDPTPSKSAVTLKCLWVDMSVSVATDLSTERIQRHSPGWVEGAAAVARVAVKDAALDPEEPFGPTVFTGAEYVEFQGTRYLILSVQPMQSGFTLPGSYYVWLKGARL